MNEIIKVLTEEVIGKISAGEVVERPASVVKELVENSIDAGSDSIQVELKDAGISLIRVADNGSGMSSDDAKLSFLRHATSKLDDINDLESLKTFGFRGEALSSISAVSRFELTTFNDVSDSPVYIYIEEGNVKDVRPAARTKGTTIEVKDLFYKIPARKKFLKKESTELAAIIDTVGRMIISNEGIEFGLVNNGRKIFHVPKSASIKDRIAEVLGRDFSDNVINVEHDFGDYKVRGYLSKPAGTRKDKRMQLFFVNGRYIRNNILSLSLQEGYKSLLERGRYPSCVLFIDVDPAKVDVNVHPAKLLIKFEDDRRLKSVIIDTIRMAFESTKKKEEYVLREYSKSQVDNSEGNEAVFTETPALQREFDYPGKTVLSSNVDEKDLEHQELNIADMPFTAQPGLYQIGKCYIVELEDEGITVTDQHAAHERILYEFFSKKAGGKTAEVQNLLFPLNIDLAASEAIVMEKIKDSFAQLGFEIESFGENSFVIRTAPAALKDRDIKNVVYDILGDIIASKSTEMVPVEEMIKYASCRGAVKSGDVLTQMEMKVILTELQKCDLPFTCPHGRPTRFDITVDELEKRFRRK